MHRTQLRYSIRNVKFSDSRALVAPPTLPQLSSVFVYGTLLAGMRNHRLVMDHAEKVIPARVYGFTLAHFADGNYPGIFHAPTLATRWRHRVFVEGELFFLKAGEENIALGGMDELEDFYGSDDPRNEYQRTNVVAYPTSELNCDTSSGARRLVLPGAPAVHAQTYVMVGTVGHLGGVVVADGDWRKHLRDLSSGVGTDNAD